MKSRLRYEHTTTIADPLSKGVGNDGVGGPDAEARRVEGDMGESITSLTDEPRGSRATDGPVLGPRSESQDEETVRMGQKVSPMIAIDLDGTILDEIDVDTSEGEFGAPIPGAIEALGALKDLGWKIIIWTARLSFAPDEDTRDEWIEEIAEYLGSQNIPFDDIAIEKPPADVFIDNKQVVQFDGDWDEVVRIVTQQYVERPDAGLTEEGEIVAAFGGFGLGDDQYQRGSDNLGVTRHRDRAYYED
jgi:hypothetical protein